MHLFSAAVLQNKCSFLHFLSTKACPINNQVDCASFSCWVFIYTGSSDTWRSSCYRDERFKSFQHWQPGSYVSEWVL